MPVIDFHIHLGRYEEWHPWVVEWFAGSLTAEEQAAMRAFLNESLTPEGLRGLLRDNGLDYAVALAEESPITTGMVTNESVAALCQGIPELLPFCNINPNLETDPARELARLVKELGFKGLKLLPSYQQFYANEARLYPVYATAQELGIPILVHTGSSVFRGSRLKYTDPLYLDDVAVDFPDLNIVMAHSGRGAWYEEAFLLARLHRNVYMEVSGLPPQKLLHYFPELERLADKVIFGSDWPGMPFIARNMALIRELPLKESTKAKILGENAARVLGLG